MHCSGAQQQQPCRNLGAARYWSIYGTSGRTQQQICHMARHRLVKFVHHRFTARTMFHQWHANNRHFCNILTSTKNVGMPVSNILSHLQHACDYRHNTVNYINGSLITTVSHEQWLLWYIIRSGKITLMDATTRKKTCMDNVRISHWIANNTFQRALRKKVKMIKNVSCCCSGKVRRQCR